MNRKIVKHIASLANLKLTKKEINKFQEQLSEILDYVDQLNQLEAKKIEPTSQVTGLENVFKEDEPKASLSQEEVLAGTKQKEKGMFKVKAIFE